MEISMEKHLRQGLRRLRRWAGEPRGNRKARLLAWGVGGFCLSAAGLRGAAMPLTMGLICMARGWEAAVCALGAAAGYVLLWGEQAAAGCLWVLGALALAMPGRGDILTAALGALWVSAVGLAGQMFWQEAVSPGVYLLRVALAPAAVMLGERLAHRRENASLWLAGAVGVLALGGIQPLPFLNLGCAGAAALAVAGSFPAAVLGSMALDLAGVSPAPLGAAVCGGYFFRLLPGRNRYLRWAAPVGGYLAAAVLSGVWDPAPVAALALGGLIGCMLPPEPALRNRRGETGAAQVRLELAAGVFSRMQEALLENRDLPPDREALAEQVRYRACDLCSARSACTDRNRITGDLLDHPLDFTCRKPGRVMAELRRAREQLRQTQAMRCRREEYRAALVQQYRFLGEYLRDLSDKLSLRGERAAVYYRLEVCARSAAREASSADRCWAFPGVGCSYYVLLCDGMGTGLGAAEESRDAGALLRQLLKAGAPPEYALGCLNSLLALEDRAGAVTVDLAQVRLDTGRVSLYKWGAAPSWHISSQGQRRLGQVTFPPGLGVEERPAVTRLRLRRGETLVMVSDGVAAEALPEDAGDRAPGDLAEGLIRAAPSPTDDATAVVIRLHRAGA